MTNQYLYIEDGVINYQDNVFSGVAHFDNKEKFKAFCLERANDCRTSDLGNFDDFTQEQREEIARRWEAAIDLQIGEYDYYFNLEDKVETFKLYVGEIAKRFGIDYELILK